MEILLDKLLENIIMNFHIKDKLNIDVKSKIDDGFSNAEVYLVELKGSSEIKGYFFLKIDKEADEYENNQNNFCFSKVAKCIKKSKINDYYVMLFQIAGFSSLKYKSFYSIYDSNIKIEAVKKIIGEILEEATNNRDIVDDDLAPTKLFKMQLKNKLDLDGIIAKFLSKHLSEKPIKDIFLIQINNEIFPNAFSYAINDTPWNNKTIKNMTCCIHGDFHGNNVFISKENGDYAIIDMASYQENSGWLFYDTAYLEYSLMFHNMGNESLANWIHSINHVAKKIWDKVDFKDSTVIRTIIEEEEKWIEKKITDKFNYFDQLYTARLIARVLVGLNYSGKKNMSDDARLKAYMFACCYLNCLVKIEEIGYPPCMVCMWKSDLDINPIFNKNKEGYSEFINFASNFDDSQNYYLVLGRDWNYSDSVSINLSKIYLSGIISFCREKGFSDILQKKHLLKYIIPNNKITWDYIKKDSTWWLYADGMKADPESWTETFPKWKIKYREFWNQFINKMIESITKDEFLFIIDATKFENEDNKYIRYLLDQLDAIEGVDINVAILDVENRLCNINSQDYANLRIRSFKICIENIAEYCSLYLSETVDNVVYIPNRTNRIGIPLNSKDQQYIEKHTILVHEQLIRRENILSESDKYNFFYGEPITWTAIEEELYVKHKKIKFYETKIHQKLENANKDQILISIPHSPGAGATILGRIVCWNLKKEYPTFILENKLNDDIYESLLRIASISGKHLLVFLDGNYNENDVTQFLYRTKGIKICILYPYRIYNIGITNNEEVISILQSREGDLFQEKYEKVMKKWKNYNEKECEKRIKNMCKLTTENNLINFRIPFFYGMHAFENDYQGIHKYLNAVIKFMEQHENMEKVILYIALISYYTENKGLGFKYARKLLKMDRQSGRELLKELQENFPSIIYIVNSSYRICHPIVAKEILEMKFKKFESEQYKNFCIQFIQNLRKCEPDENVSDMFSELMMEIFIKRDTEGEIKEKANQKKSFSQIILEIGNSNLQEQIYEKLVEVLPQNPHFHQHYGRLIIANNPTALKRAEKQLDEAIKLDDKNGIFYHSRGNIYVQYILYQMNNSYKNSSGNELFNKLCYYVDLAINDFKNSVELEKKENNISNLVYPYTSIIQITTTFVHQLAKKLGFSNNEKEFLEEDKEINRWSKKLISDAFLYDIDTELRYNLIRANEFYNNTRSYLTRFKWSSNELETKIKKYPNDYDYQIAYLRICVSEKGEWKQKSQQQLRQIIICCENLLKIDSYETEGVLWKWFNAYIRLEQSVTITYNKMLGILETLPERDLNATANYLCSILYFCKYLLTKDEKMIDAMYACIQVCRKLAGNRKNQSVTHYYYTDGFITRENILPLEFDRENAYWFDATIVNVNSMQSGYLTLDINSKLRAFFVPVYTELKRNQEIGQSVKVKIGFRFDGLSAWEIEPKIK